MSGLVASVELSRSKIAAEQQQGAHLTSQARTAGSPPPAACTPPEPRLQAKAGVGAGRHVGRHVDRQQCSVV